MASPTALARRFDSSAYSGSCDYPPSRAASAGGPSICCFGRACAKALDRTDKVALGISTTGMRNAPSMADVIASNLRALMTEHALSQAELARRSGVGQATISKMFGGEAAGSNPRISTLAQLAAYFRVPISQFTGGPEVMRPGHAHQAHQVNAPLLARSLMDSLKTFRSKGLLPSDEAIASAAADAYAELVARQLAK